MHVGVRSLVAIAAFVGLTGSGAATSIAVTPALQTAPVVAGAPESGAGYDGVVQAVRQTVIAAQVSGAVVALDVKAGDVVKAGQVLLRLDSRSAEHAAAASAAQLRAAQATQQAATRDYERQKQLFEKRYISQAALDRAEELYNATTAQAAAQMATAMAAQTESGFYTVRAPYSGRRFGRSRRARRHGDAGAAAPHPLRPGRDARQRRGATDGRKPPARR